MSRLWLVFFIIVFVALAVFCELYSQASSGTIFVLGTIFGSGGTVLYDMAKSVEK